MRTTSIPITDPRHPIHRQKEQAELDAMFGRPPRAKPPPQQYEDQYGNTRWSDTHDVVNRQTHGGR